MKNKLIILIKYTILLGTIAIALNILFGENTIIYVEKSFIPHTNVIWYKYNFSNYFNNLYTEITKTTQLQLQVPTRSWQGARDIIGWLMALSNNLKVILDYIIMIINVLLYPLKVGGYVMNSILAILGINVGNGSGLKWLGDMAKSLISLSIPYL